jgi:hypothetical protein
VSRKDNDVARKTREETAETSAFFIFEFTDWEPLNELSMNGSSD